jgi:hypothetical protein
MNAKWQEFARRSFTNDNGETETFIDIEMVDVGNGVLLRSHGGRLTFVPGTSTSAIMTSTPSQEKPE